MVDAAPRSTQQVPLLDQTPLAGKPLGRRLRVVDSQGQRAVLAGDTPIHVYDRQDKVAENACIALIGGARLASRAELAEVFGRHRNSISHLCLSAERQGMGAVLPHKRGPRGPHKLTPEVRGVIAEHHQLGCVELARRIEEKTGVGLSVGYVSRLQQRYREQAAETQVEQLSVGLPDAEAESGETLAAAWEVEAAVVVAAEEQDEAAAEAEPAVVVPDHARGRYMGAALYYPALQVLGLIDAARSCFRLPNSEQFGVRAIFLTMFYLSILCRDTVEASKHLRRWELGAVIGCGRAPVTKTLRRKLAALVGQAQALEFGRRLARRWVEQSLIATACLYVDGHIKAYTGARKLQRVWDSRSKQTLPGFATYFVNDRRGRPLLFLNGGAGESLHQSMPAIVAEIRKALGERRFVVAFDRGGFSSQLFTWLKGQAIDFVTYQVGEVELPRTAFHRRRTRVGGRRRFLSIAEDLVEINGSGPWRRIIVLTASGHQVPILTSLRLPAASVAAIIFARWSEENFFKYMRQHLGLDVLTSYAAAAADGSRLIPNPERKDYDWHLKQLRRHLEATQADLGRLELLPDAGPEPRRRRREAWQEYTQLASELETEIAELQAQRKPLPTHVPLEAVGGKQEMRLEQKAIIDRVKISAYNAEEWLLERLLGHYPNPHDARALLRSWAELSGEMHSTPAGVRITLDAPDNPQQRRALRGLCADLNQVSPTYPGTTLPVTYDVAMHKSESPV